MFGVGNEGSTPGWGEGGGNHCMLHICVLSLNISCWLLLEPGCRARWTSRVTQCDCSGVGEYLPWKVSVCPIKDCLKANIIWTHDSCYSSICLNDVENMVNERIG